MLTSFETDALILSLKAALFGTIGAFPFALALGRVMARRFFPGKWFVDWLILLPLVLPPVAVGYGLLILFGRRGFIGSMLHESLQFAFNWKGAALAAGVMALPLMTRAIRIGFEAIDPKVEWAARTLGAAPVRVFAAIVVPLAAPAIFAGAILGFARAVGEFGATITFVSNIPGETQTIPLALYNALQTPDAEWAAARLLFLSLVLSALALAASEGVRGFMARPRK